MSRKIIVHSIFEQERGGGNRPAAPCYRQDYATIADAMAICAARLLKYCEQLQFLVLFCGIMLSTLCFGFPAVTKIQDTTVDTQAMTLTAAPYGYAINGLSFQQEIIWTHNNWQYVTWYNGAKHVCVARRQLPTGAWQIIELTDYTISTTTDAHNVISIGICPNDGTIHLSFDHHGHPLKYRISQTGAATDPNGITWNASIFGAVRNYLEVGKTVSGVTYPAFWTTPSGNLQMYYRVGGSGDGDSVFVDYDAAAGIWKNTRKVISRSGLYSDLCGSNETTRNPYHNGICYGPDGVLQLTFCWRESSGGTNHDICHAYSPDGGYSWYNTKGSQQSTKIAVGSGSSIQTLIDWLWTSTGPEIVGQSTGNSSTEQLISVASKDIIAIPITRYYGLMNQQCQAVDPQGQIHTVMYHCTDESYTYAASQGQTSFGCNLWGPAIAKNYHHYWRDSGGLWHHNPLPGFAGNRGKLFFRANGDTFFIYRNADSDLIIQAATAANLWTDWQVIHTEPGPFLNEMLGDPYRFKQQQILSVVTQDTPAAVGASTPLRVLDFQVQ